MKKDYVVCALYRFVGLKDYQEMRQPLLQSMQDLHIRGTLLLAKEGINGTIAGSRSAVDSLLKYLRNDPRLQGLDSKESFVSEMPFKRCKVKLKKEIVTLGIEGLDPLQTVGTYVEPKEWNALLQDPDTTVIDTRNHYETKIGSFKGALDPHTESFREFPEYIEKNIDPAKQKKVAMFCTGGIRCEKSTALLKEMGYENVYHLRGGILNYLKEVPEKDSLWEGECFVFDDRVSVNHQLQKGCYDQCGGCRGPINEEDKKHPHYTEGVSCASCYASLTEDQKQRFAERHKQMQLSSERGELHIGDGVEQAAAARREKKKQKKKLQQDLHNKT